MSAEQIGAAALRKIVAHQNSPKRAIIKQFSK